MNLPFLSETQPTSPPIMRLTAALVVLCLALFLPGQGALSVMDRDEARFAQASKQMIESGDYVRIQFQDQDRAKKPVGIYWLQSFSAKMFGGEDATIRAYRLPSLLGATLAVLATFYFGTTLFGARIAFAGAGLLAGSLILVNEAHLAKTDAVLLAATVITQGALARYYLAARRNETTPGIGTFAALWLGLGAGILIKGPVTPLVAVLTIIALGVSDKNLRWLLPTRPLIGILISAVVVLPWVIAISSDGGGGDGNFIMRAISEDLLPKLLSGQESHGAPPGYYTLLSLVGLWPASLFLVPALFIANDDKRLPEIRFALAWALPMWLVFELIPTKLPHYVLPAFPALTLLIAYALAKCTCAFTARTSIAFAALWAIPGLALAGAAIALPIIAGDGFSLWSLPAAAGALLATFGGLRFYFQGSFWQAASVATVGAVMVYGSVFQGVLPATTDAWISQRMHSALATHNPTGAVPDARPVSISGYREPSAVFLLGTHTVFTSPQGAAQDLANSTHRAAFISQTDDASFKTVMHQTGRRALRLETIDGFNYTKGKPITLHLYVLDNKGTP